MIFLLENFKLIRVDKFTIFISRFCISASVKNLARPNVEKIKWQVLNKILKDSFLSKISGTMLNNFSWLAKTLIISYYIRVKSKQYIRQAI